MVQKIKVRAESAASATTPDAFVSAGAGVVEWFQRHARRITSAVAVFFGVAALIAAASYFQAHRHGAASWDLAQALKVYHRSVATAPPPEGADKPPPDEQPFASTSEKYTAAKAAFAKVAQDHEGSGVAALAQAYLADCHVHLGEWDAAITAQRAFLAATGESDPLRPVVMIALAHALEGKGDAKGARDAFDEVVALPGKAGKDSALYHAARLRMGSQEPAAKTEAKALLERLGKEFDASPLKTKAEELLSAVQ